MLDLAVARCAGPRRPSWLVGGVSTGGPAGRHVRGKFWCCFYPVVFLMTPLPLVVFLCIFGEISPCFLHDPERTVRRVTHGLEGSS